MSKDFKIPEKYLIDFDNLKVGDRVWHVINGYVRIDRIDKKDDYSIMIEDNFYTNGGKFWETDQYPSLFRVNPFEDIREEFFADRLMEVRDNNGEDWNKRVVFGKKNGKWLSWSHSDNLQDAQDTMGLTTWQQAREITPPSEELVHLTLQDISEGKGKGVPAHLIRIKE